jgi:hypothetical protein
MRLSKQRHSWYLETKQILGRAIPRHAMLYARAMLKRQVDKNLLPPSENPNQRDSSINRWPVVIVSNYAGGIVRGIPRALVQALV